MQSIEEYRYEPLLGGEIRLLSIALSSDPDLPPRCELHHYSQSELPKYEAVSYTWGNVNYTTAIYCNGRTLRVTENCAATLMALREQQGKTPDVVKIRPKLYWIDAICINQTDLQEKNVQVRRMALVYGQALRTIVYLGKSDEASDFFADVYSVSLDYDKSEGAGDDYIWTLELHECLADYFESTPIYRRPLIGDNLTRVLERNPGPLPTQTLNESADGVMKAENNEQHAIWAKLFESLRDTSINGLWLRFFLRSWFTRIWVVQEVMHSYDIVLMCGTRELPWRAMRCVQETVRACYGQSQIFRRIEEQPGRRRVDPITFPQTARSLLLPQIARTRLEIGVVNRRAEQAMAMFSSDGFLPDDSHVSEYPGGLKLWRLLPFLKSTWYFQGQDPRDKLYAIVSLFEMPLPALLVPDYTKATAQVYADLTWFLIDYGTPEVFPLAGLDQSENSTPTWVVNWASSRRRYFEMIGSIEADDDYGAGYMPGYKRMVAKRENNVLVIRGIMIDSLPPSYVRKAEKSMGRRGDCIAIFLGVREVYKLTPFQDGWQLIGTSDAPEHMHGQAVENLDWDTVDSESPSAPLQDFRIY